LKVLSPGLSPFTHLAATVILLHEIFKILWASCISSRCKAMNVEACALARHGYPRFAQCHLVTDLDSDSELRYTQNSLMEWPESFHPVRFRSISVTIWDSEPGFRYHFNSRIKSIWNMQIWSLFSQSFRNDEVLSICLHFPGLRPHWKGHLSDLTLNVRKK
jgi:hypothetical protein